MKKIKVGVIGVGYLGEHHARVYSQLKGVELVGVVDVNKNRADEIARKINTRAYYDYRDIIKLVDAVSIVVPTRLHYKIADEFLNKGVDILLEKPITITVSEADKLIKKAKAKRLILQVGHIERYNSAVMALEPVIDRPRYIESRRFGPFADRVSDVDVILDMMIHDIDIILSLVDSDIKSINATGVSVMTSHNDIANAHIEFTNGCVANLTVSRMSMDKLRKISIYQPETYITIDYKEQEIILHKRIWNRINNRMIPEISTENIDLIKEEPLKAELASFIESVKTRKKPIVSGIEGRKALEVALKVLKDAKKRRLLLDEDSDGGSKGAISRHRR
ncbi:MAG: Gfo/Idh/MocA family oxidoreductase [Nitrospirae bacterium]|nr:Gfo/Idh/MocA family oxidoreductase [Nitrospirota bacterium]